MVSELLEQLGGLMSQSEKDFVRPCPEIQAVSEKVKQEIKSILLDNYNNIYNLLVSAEKDGRCELSENPINKFNKETELKILNIDPDKIIEILELAGLKKVFEGIVEDVYFDFEDLSLDRDDISLRLRKKTCCEGIVKFYYTIKRKHKNETNSSGLRTSAEKELRVFQPTFILLDFKKIGLVESRRKIKKRISFFEPLFNIKFDIDIYMGKKIPPLLEIEIEPENIDLLPLLYKKLGVENNEKTTVGSRGVAKLFGENQDENYIRNGDKIEWKDGKTKNLPKKSKGQDKSTKLTTKSTTKPIKKTKKQIKK